MFPDKQSEPVAQLNNRLGTTRYITNVRWSKEAKGIGTHAF